MYQIATYAHENNKLFKLFNYFESSGEVIYQYQKNAIERAFGCKVINRYGLAEAGIVAYQVDMRSDCMKIMDHLVYMESRDRSTESNVVITTLKNRAMPLIRYDTGDIALFQKNASLLELKEIQGRVHDVIHLGDKAFMTHTLMDIIDHRIGGVLEWQVVNHLETQKTELLIVPIDRLDNNRVEELLLKYLHIKLPFRIVSFSELVRVGTREKFRHSVEL
jgi:phenylacetate-CoA ligase